MLNRRETPWKIILIYLVFCIGMMILINLVLFPSPFFNPIVRATSGLVNATLQAGLINLLLFGLFIFGWARLRPTDVGLQWRKLPHALLVTGALWAGMQAIALIMGWINGDIQFDPLWSKHGVTAVLGALLGQLLGNSLFEETLYRGFILPEFFLKIKIKNQKWRTAGAIAGMLILFILSHIPNRIFAGYSLADIPFDFALLTLYGLLFTAIYLLSGNLFLAVGVHALVNAPTMIIATSFEPQIILLVLAAILLVVLWKKPRKTAVSSGAAGA